MAKLSTSEIGRLAKAAGFPSDVIPTMVAIALAESGGDPNAHNTKAPDDSYGLWQINMRGDMGPTRRQQFGITSDSQLLNPSVNAKAAYVIYKSQGLNAWTTYSSGTYKSHLNEFAAGAIDQLTGQVAGGVANISPDNDVAVAGGLSALGSNLFKVFSNVQGIMIAIVMLVLGVVILMRNVIPVGKVAKVIGKVAK